ncbi:AbrB/MazE/SpoVT family DNA-binding domain-containing protein [Thiolapillus sp.]
MLKVKVIRIGNSTGIEWPRMALRRFDVTEGDELYLVEKRDGLILIPCERHLDEQLQAAEQVLKRYRDTLRRLAK